MSMSLANSSTIMRVFFDLVLDSSEARTFDDVFRPIEEVTVPLQYAYKSVKHLSTVKTKKFGDAFEGVGLIYVIYYYNADLII